MKKLLCFLGFHTLERRGRFIHRCTREDCNAQSTVTPSGETLKMDWRWDLSLWQRFR